jgi:hypothetical protein
VTVAASTKIGYGNKSLEISKITNGGKWNRTTTIFTFTDIRWSIMETSWKYSARINIHYLYKSRYWIEFERYLVHSICILFAPSSWSNEQRKCNLMPYMQYISINIYLVMSLKYF